MFIILLLIAGGVIAYHLHDRIGTMRHMIEDLEHRLILIEDRAAVADQPVAKSLVEAASASIPSTRTVTIRPPAPSVPIARAVTPPPIEPTVDNAVPAPAPMAEQEDEITSRSFGFEDLFGRRLPIWAGGITLAIAGVLLVKYSIEAGLLSPLVRVVLGLAFGIGLIAGAELALRQADRVRDPRVQQALAGAGIATLYAVILAATNLYGLIGGGTAFSGLAAVTALAMALSLRFGAPSALLGLVGGMAAPALVSTGQPNVPLLACYLALAAGGLCTLSRTQRWTWLGVGALVGGAGWGAVLIVSGALDAAAAISVGLLVIALGVGLPMVFAGGGRGKMVRTLSAIVAAAQMAALVATGGFAMLHWGLFGLLSIGLVWLSMRDASLRPLAAVGLAVALMLAIVWPAPALGPFVLVMAGIAMILGGPALWRLWRADGGLIEAGQIAGLALGGFTASFAHFDLSARTRDGALALVAFGCAAMALAAMALGWRCVSRRNDARFAMLATAGALLLATAGALGLAGWMLALVIAAVAATLPMLALAAGDDRVLWSGWAFAFASVVVLICGPHGIDETAMLFGFHQDTTPMTAGLRWAGATAMAGLFAWRGRIGRARIAAQSAATLLGYGAFAQWIPDSWLPATIAIALPILAESARRLPVHRLLPALIVATALAIGWALVPMADWTAHALLSAFGDPMLVPDKASIHRLAVPAIGLALAAWRAREAIGRTAYEAGIAIAALFGLIAAHMVFKQIFAIASTADAVRIGLAERSLWEALLLATAFGLWRVAGARSASARIAASILTGAALVHNIWYSQILHGPIWSGAMVGSLPVANLLIPAFALPVAALWLGNRIMPETGERLGRAIEIGRMILILLFVHASWRQAFAGSMLTRVPVGPVEDIGRSVIAIALAIGFLLWGIRQQQRDWRIASLLLMLAAVAKVFLFDASGLEGLLRIASFMALGFSLIGIGWLYSRQLRDGSDGA